MNDMSFKGVDNTIADFFRQQPKPKKFGKPEVAIKRSPYKGQPIPKAIGRVWIVRAKNERIFASENSANAFAALIVAKLRQQMLEDNIANVQPEEIPEATANNFRDVQHIMADKFGYIHADYVNIIEMGVFA
jgi:hypothetical protein